MLRVASGDRSSMSGVSGAAACAPVARRARSCGARLACGTRMGIPRWLSDGARLDDSGAVPGLSSAGGGLAMPASLRPLAQALSRSPAPAD
jgi:hypothetical protein